MNPQSGILTEGDNSAFFATYKVNYNILETKEGFDGFVSSLKQFPSILETVSTLNTVRVTGTISFGKRLWELITKDNTDLNGTGSEMFDFPGYNQAPATQEDLYLHIHSTSSGASYDCGASFVALFAPDMLTCADDKMGFVWRDSRDLTGFIDGTENPAGPEDRTSAAINADGCSFVMVQRFIHNLNKWDTLEKSDQESIIGRTKEDSVQLEPVPIGSHVAHTDIDHNGVNVKIVRHSLPYGMPSGDKGLWFTAYCHYLDGLDEMEKSIYGMREDGIDMLMFYISAVTGGYYYVPSLEMLAKL